VLSASHGIRLTPFRTTSLRMSPRGGEHIALTGEYVWSWLTPRAEFRPLRDIHAAFLPGLACSFEQIVR